MRSLVGPYSRLLLPVAGIAIAVALSEVALRLAPIPSPQSLSPRREHAGLPELQTSWDLIKPGTVGLFAGVVH